MARARNPVEKLVLAGQKCARAPENEGLADTLTQRALEVAHDGLWADFVTAVQHTEPNVKACICDAMTHVVEHPILADTAGKVYHGRTFAIPVTQLIGGEMCLQSLPMGATVERLLTEALCPTGKGMLVNRLLPDAVMAELSFEHAWSLAKDALTAEVGEYASPLVPYTPHGVDGLISALHFVLFIALVPEVDSEELLSLDEDDLAIRTLPAMDAVNSVINDQLDADQQDDIQICTHLPQPLFYDIDVVNLGHETFLFSTTVGAWEQAAADEGSALTLQVALDSNEHHAAIVISGNILGEQAGQYRFAVDSSDTDMQAEVCASVDELARQRGLRIQFTGKAAVLVGEAPAQVPMTMVMDGPRTLQ